MSEHHPTTADKAPGPAAPAPQWESFLERLLFGSRWLMAPMYFGLAVSLALLAWMFLRELVENIQLMLTGHVDDSILVVLSLIDLTLAANLVLIVLFSGYENFVSKLSIPDGGYRPDWMGKIDYSALKMKLVGSIIAISAIQLLRRFMEVGQSDEPLDESKLYWMTAIHLTFVISGLLLAVMDYLGARSGGKH